MAALEVSRYSTQDIEVQHRHEAWRNRDWPSFGPLFDTRLLEPFETDSAKLTLDYLIIQYARLTSQEFTRGKSHIRTDGVDNLAVNIRIAGTASGDAEGRAFRAPVGSAVFMDMARQSIHISQASDTVLILIPRAIAEKRLLPMRELHGLILSPSRAALLLSFTNQLLASASELATDQSRRLADTVVDLIAVALNGPGDERPDQSAAIETAMKIRARIEVERRLSSATLSAEALCRSLKISRSTLYRMFESDGGIQAYIRDHRLERVRQELIDCPLDRIGKIAERSGFFDAAYFSRVFRAKFGMTPREFRAAEDCRRAAR